MSALHIDPVELAKNEPAVSRDLNKLCSLCADKRQCKRDLDAGSFNSRWRRYCPNSRPSWRSFIRESARRTLATDGSRELFER